MLFLIAADDAALREHLMTRAPQVLDPGEGGDRQRAERYADEYLRKFFNTAISLRPVLDDDIREYMREHLSALAGRWDGEPQLEDLVRLCAAGLRHNPRRVKQFVNNMELRLQLIRSRETTSTDHQSKIEPPISKNLPMVAKLALIEEEWPDRFSQLRRRPSLLREWHRAAAEKAIPDGEGGDDWAEFSAFLTSTAYIETPSLRPYLRLKRSRTEAGLPRYDEFHDALTASEPTVAGDVLSEFLEQAKPDLIDRYASRVPEVAEEELRAGNLPGAISAVSAAVSSSELAARKAPRSRLLNYVAHEPDLRDGMRQLPAEPLVAAISDLSSATNRHALLRVLIGEFAGREATSAKSVELAEALGGVAEDLPSDLADQVRAALQDQLRVGHYDSYVPLVKRRPDLLPTEAAKHAFDALQQASSESGTLQLSGAGAGWEVVKAGVRAGVLDDQNPLLDHFMQAMTNSPPEQLGQVLSDIKEVVPDMKVSSKAWLGFLSKLVQFIQQGQQRRLDAEARTTAIELARDVVAQVEPNRRDTAAGQVADLVLADLAAGVEYIIDHAEDLPEDLRQHLVAQLPQQLEQNPRQVATALLALDEAGAPETLAQAAVTAAKNGSYATLALLLEDYVDYIRTKASDIAEPLIQRIQQAPSQSAPPEDFRALGTLGAAMTDSQKERVATTVVDLMHRQPGQWTAPIDELLNGLGADRSAKPALRTVLEQLLGKLGENDVASVQPHLDIVLRFERLLTPEEKQQVVDRLVFWLRTQPAEAASLGEASRRLGKLAATPSGELVAALIAADHQQANDAVDARKSLVTAAVTVANGKKASAAVKEHLTHLATGSKADQEVRQLALAGADAP